MEVPLATSLQHVFALLADALLVPLNKNQHCLVPEHRHSPLLAPDHAALLKVRNQTLNHRHRQAVLFVQQGLDEDGGCTRVRQGPQLVDRHGRVVDRNTNLGQNGGNDGGLPERAARCAERRRREYELRWR